MTRSLNSRAKNCTGSKQIAWTVPRTASKIAVPRPRRGCLQQKRSPPMPNGALKRSAVLKRLQRRARLLTDSSWRRPSEAGGDDALLPDVPEDRDSFELIAGTPYRARRIGYDGQGCAIYDERS